jgi:hypothetical protein
MPQKATSTEQVPGFVSFPALMGAGSDRLQATLDTQKEFFAACEEASRNWMDRIRLETEMTAELTAKLGTCKSIADVAAAYQEWVRRHMQLLGEDGQKLMAESQKLAGAYARMFTNGFAGAAKKTARD